MASPLPRPERRRLWNLWRKSRPSEGSAEAARKRHKLAKVGKPRRRVKTDPRMMVVPDVDDLPTRGERKRFLRAWAAARETERQADEMAKLVKFGIPQDVARRQFGSLQG